jgi:flagellar assembly protein FliH
MKNTLFSGVAEHAFPIPVASFLYRDICAPVLKIAKETAHGESSVDQASGRQAAPGLSVQEVDNLLNLARAEAVAETEKRLEKKHEASLAAEAEKIRLSLELFLEERKGYFSKVESDVVHLALAISAKILHREAQVDPLLVAALVRVAVDKLHDGSSVSVRVSPEKAGKWRDYLANPLNGSIIAIVEDTTLSPDDCILETDLGSANFSIDAQLKEVEAGFFDLLAQRPPIK